MRRARLIDTNLGAQARAIFGGISKNPVTRRAETVMARAMREALKEAINRAIDNAYMDGSFPSRTGRGYAQTRGKAQAFGTTFGTLRGHITAPLYLVAQDRGALIEPVNARKLAIPVFEALRADGTPKLPSPNSWRMLGSFVYKSKRTGQVYIARKTPSGKVSVLYLLVDSVQLTKHKGWAQAAFERELPRLANEWGRILTTYAITVANVEQAYVKGGGTFR